MRPSYKLWIGGEWQTSDIRLEILSPFDGKIVAETHQADADQMEEAIAASVSAFEKFKKISRYTRERLLKFIVADIEKYREDFLEKMIHEAGKPKTSAEIEIQRALATFTLAAEETKRFGGEVIPLDLDAGGRAYGPAISFWKPRGPILAITPFNFPLNLVAHKIAPALAVGATVVLKPPPQAPGCAILLAEIFERAAREISGGTEGQEEKIPLDALQVLNASNEIMAKAVKDPRLTVLSFTGSDKVGWMLQGQAIRKKVLLELGGNAAVIIHRDADLKRAAQRCAAGGFGYAGQTCISVQRIFAHVDIIDAFTKYLLEFSSQLKSGDPDDKNISVGPLIDSNAASRVEQWIEEAKQKGARILLGGKRQGNVIPPTVLASVPKECKISCEEVFGPVVVINSYTNFSEALESVNESRFGLQAGVFTENSRLIRQSFEELDVGAVIVNDIPTYRADNMPYGGVKDSGLGREGLRYAMEDYCERRTLVTWHGMDGEKK